MKSNTVSEQIRPSESATAASESEMPDSRPALRPIQRPTYPTIPLALSAYSVIGMSTPSAVSLKLPMLRAHRPEQRTAIVVFDTFRCSSTLLTCFAGGAFAAMIMEKGLEQRGTPTSQAQMIAARFGRRLISAGELHGKPVPGGAVGNSPADACEIELNGCCVHFQSTNFARAFIEMVDYAQQTGGEADVFVISIQNAEITASALREGSYERVLAVCGGFFECLALEDMITGGMLVAHLDVAEELLDDEALTMLACYKSFSTSPQRYQTCWTGRVLARIGRGEDVDDIVGPESRIPPAILKAMRSIVLKVRWIDGMPIVFSSPLTSRELRTSYE